MSFPCTAAMHFADIRFTRHYVLAITVPLVYAAFSLGDGMCPEGRRNAMVFTGMLILFRCFDLFGAYRLDINARSEWAQGLQQKHGHAVMSGLLSRCVDCVA